MPRRVRAATRPAGPRLLSMWAAFSLATLASAAALTGVILVGVRVLGVTAVKPEAQLSGATMFDLLKIAFAVVAGAGGLVALVTTYRRQRVSEAAESREATALFNERFSTVTDKLGHDRAAVRLAGVHGLAGLADDAPNHELRQTCIDVLCAYLRMPQEHDEDGASGRSDRQVRHTVIRCIAAHLRTGAAVPWRKHDFDFTEAVFDGGDLSAVVFDGAVGFTRAEFRSGRTSFEGAIFRGPRTDFDGAGFGGGDVRFDGATFSGGRVTFIGSDFRHGRVSFAGAKFVGDFVSFDGASFSGAEVDFRAATGTPPAGVVTVGRSSPDVSLPREWLTPGG
ncbi:pentapeptide repeat-containing protein [Streptosporangium soli]|nr:pentapeptide repeat-containing protein [Streptosporangium sp. KLBMP 9127]